MERFRSTYIPYEGQQQLIGDLVSRARYHARTNRSYALEIIVHLQDHAHETNDSELFYECRKLMSIVESSSPYPMQRYNQTAADENNRPQYPESPIEEAPYDNSLDGIFDERIKVQKVKGALDRLSFKKKGRVEWFVIYKVLLYLRWLKNGCKQKAFLKWVNLQYNCEWTEDRHFTFSRDVDKEMRNRDISCWHMIDYNKYTKGKTHYNFAVLLRNTFEIVIVNGREATEPVTDFLIGSNRDRHAFMANPGQLINWGK